MPSMQELIIKTGRTRQDITGALTALENQGFIVWENKKEVRTVSILKGWEDTVVPERKRPVTGNIDYWTQY